MRPICHFQQIIPSRITTVRPISSTAIELDSNHRSPEEAVQNRALMWTQKPLFSVTESCPRPVINNQNCWLEAQQLHASRGRVGDVNLSFYYDIFHYLGKYHIMSECKTYDIRMNNALTTFTSVSVYTV